MALEDITAKIERLEVVEDRLGVALRGLSAFVDRHDFQGNVVSDIYVQGELYGEMDPDPTRWVRIHIEIYDTTATLVTRSFVGIRADKFLGFDSFDRKLQVINKKDIRIRIYPEMGSGSVRYRR